MNITAKTSTLKTFFLQWWCCTQQFGHNTKCTDPQLYHTRPSRSLATVNPPSVCCVFSGWFRTQTSQWMYM